MDSTGYATTEKTTSESLPSQLELELGGYTGQPVLSAPGETASESQLPATVVQVHPDPPSQAAINLQAPDHLQVERQKGTPFHRSALPTAVFFIVELLSDTPPFCKDQHVDTPLSTRLRVVLALVPVHVQHRLHRQKP